MATANDLRRGMAINYNGDISVVLDMQHRTPGNLRAFVQATLRSIRTGKSSDVRFSSTERIEPVPMITTKMEFSYKDGADYVFTDPESYETVTLTSELIGDAKNFLVENGQVTVTFVEEKAVIHRVAAERGADGVRRAGGHPRRFIVQCAKAGDARNGHHGASAVVHQDRRENQGGHAHGQIHGTGVTEFFDSEFRR